MAFCSRVSRAKVTDSSSGRQIVFHNGRKQCLLAFRFTDSLRKLWETESQHLGGVYIGVKRQGVKEFYRAVWAVTAIDLQRIAAPRIARNRNLSPATAAA